MEPRDRAQLLKQPHTIIHQTLYLAQCNEISAILLATIIPRLVRQLARQTHVSQYSREHVSTVIKSIGNALHCAW